MNKFAGDYNNIEELAICLQWISVLTHKIRKDIIHPQCYSDLISKVVMNLNSIILIFELI